MTIKRRIYFSMPAEGPITAQQNEFQWAVAKRVEDQGYVIEVFSRPYLKPGLASSLGWTYENVDAVARRCVGAVIIGTPRWIFDTPEGEKRFPTEFCHYEAAVARTLGLPRLVLAESDLLKRVTFDMSYGDYIVVFPRDAANDWLTTSKFNNPFDSWLNRVRQRRDVFLGYSSGAEGLADNIKGFVTAVGVTVLDWKIDFIPGGTILSQIQDAAARCSGGLFLFTKDDEISGGEQKAAPRDNVVFEAGYFSQAKGKDRVLIVRESGTKLPADLGGDIFLDLKDRSNISPIKPQLLEFFEQRF